GSTAFFLPFALLFAGAAIYVTVGRFLIDIWRRHNMTYELVDGDAVIRNTFPWTQERRVNLGRTPEISLKRGRDGPGTIEFGTKSWMSWGNASYGFGPAVPTFESIPHVDDVYALMRSMQHGS